VVSKVLDNFWSNLIIFVYIPVSIISAIGIPLDDLHPNGKQRPQTSTATQLADAFYCHKSMQYLFVAFEIERIKTLLLVSRKQNRILGSNLHSILMTANIR
jgi:hypothetical protein